MEKNTKELIQKKTMQNKAQDSILSKDVIVKSCEAKRAKKAMVLELIKRLNSSSLSWIFVKFPSSGSLKRCTSPASKRLIPKSGHFNKTLTLFLQKWD